MSAGVSVCVYVFLLVHYFVLEVAIARGEEARLLASIQDKSSDSRMGRYEWDMDRVRHLKRRVDIQIREYKAVCCCGCVVVVC